MFQELRKRAPLLDLEYLFDFDIRAYREHVVSQRPSIRAGMSFAAYRRTRASRRPAGINDLLQEAAKRDRHSKREQELEESLAYVLHLRPADVSAKNLKAHYARLLSHVQKTLEEGDDEGMLTLSEGVFPLYFGPLLKWVYGNPKYASTTLALDVIEQLLEVDHQHFSHPHFSRRALELHNRLLFIYLVVASLFRHGVLSSHVARHLRIIRATSSVSWSELPAKVRIQYGALALEMALSFYNLHEPFVDRHGFSVKTLADLRSALADASGAAAETPLVIHQWVFRKMQEKLDLDVFSTRAISRDSNALTVLDPGEQAAVVELLRMFSGFRIPITAELLGRFLLQFGTTQRIRGVVKLLTHTRFFPYWELAEAIQGILGQEIEASSAPLVLASLGDRTGSTSIINYLAKHSSLAPHLVFAEDIGHALELTRDNEKIYFVDDCVLSGTQTLSIMGDWLNTREHKPHHTRYAEPLSAAERKKLDKRSLAFVYCIASDFALKRMEDALPGVGLDPTQVRFCYSALEPLAARAFGPMSPVAWSSAGERDELKGFATEVGYQILEPRATRKGWADERRRSSALGYSDFQRLLVFPYNVPKTTLTLLWESGSESRPWQPLFPGHD